MAAEPALAIVVRGTDWSETSRITTLFTREFGKVRALAKGGRRLKSNFDVAFDLLTICQIMFIRKSHGGLDLLTEARMEEQFPALRRNLPALYAGYYVAELLADGTQDYDPHPPLFDAAVEMLRGLGTVRVSESKDPTPQPPPPVGEGEEDKGASPMSSACEGLPPPSFLGKGAGGFGSSDPTPNPLPQGERGLRTAEGLSPPSFPGKGAGGFGSSLAAVSAFELVWLQELGYSPRLDACAGCGVERLNPTAAALYSPTAGGVLCPQCGPTFADRRGASGPALVCLRELAAGAAPPELPDTVRAEVRQLLGHTVSCVLGRRPRLLGYVDGR